MIHPMIAWCMIVGVLLCAFIVRAIEQYFAECHKSQRKSRHILEIGKERDMFYIPGDINEEDDSGNM